MQTDYGICEINNNEIPPVTVTEPIHFQTPGVNTNIPTASVLHFSSSFSSSSSSAHMD